MSDHASSLTSRCFTWWFRFCQTSHLGSALASNPGASLCGMVRACVHVCGKCAVVRVSVCARVRLCVYVCVCVPAHARECMHGCAYLCARAHEITWDHDGYALAQEGGLLSLPFSLMQDEGPRAPWLIVRARLE